MDLPLVVFDEARATLEGVILAQEMGWRQIVLEGDCLSIISIYPRPG